MFFIKIICEVLLLNNYNKEFEDYLKVIHNNNNINLYNILKTKKNDVIFINKKEGKIKGYLDLILQYKIIRGGIKKHYSTDIVYDNKQTLDELISEVYNYWNKQKDSYKLEISINNNNLNLSKSDSFYISKLIK